MLVGFGYDVHRLAPGRPCILGGVRIPHERGLLGHSDADVLVHAVMDAILGAIGQRDIGQHFPNTDPRYEGADSLALLRLVVGLAGESGCRVRNLDSTVVAEEPMLAPHVEGMKRNLAEALGLSAGRVAVKATTNEGLGFIGAREGIAAFAVVSVEESEPA